MAGEQAVDYDALAAKYGGQPAPDYDALAAKYGGKPASSRPDKETQQTQAAARGAGESQRATMPVLPTMKADSDKAYGFTPTNLGYQGAEGVRQLGSGAYEMGKDVLFPQGKTEGEKLSYLGKKYIFDPANTMAAKAKTEPNFWKRQGYEAASVLPVFGPWAASLGEQAGSGDVGGALARGGAQVATAEAAKPVFRATKVAGGMAREAVGRRMYDPETGAMTPGVKVAGQLGGAAVGGAIGEQLGHPYAGGIAGYRAGPTILEKAFPEPKAQVAAREGIAQTRKITEAHESALAENVRRDRATDVQQRRTTAAAEREYNKRGDENMAIQKRADAASKAANDARAEAEQVHAKNLADIEKARQAEITAQAKLKQVQDKIDRTDAAKDAEGLKTLKQQEKQALKDANEAAAQKEKLRTMHGQDLMRRGGQQKALDKAAEDAQEELDKAVPPSQRAIHAARVARAAAESRAMGQAGYSPEEWQNLSPMDKAKATAEYAGAEERARVGGMVRSGRAATTTPYRSNESIGLGTPEFPPVKPKKP